MAISEMNSPNPDTRSSTSRDGWALVPRIRLDFTLTETKSGFGFGISKDEIKRSLSAAAEILRLFGMPVRLPVSDIHIRREMDRGTLFFRDLSFIDNGEELEKKLERGRQILLSRLSPFKMSFNTVGIKIELRAFTPVCEDANRMMDLVGPTQEPPTILLKGVPLEWFAYSTGPSRKTLGSFFQTLANVRDLNMSENNVFIQFEDYEECYKALRKLCSFSLQKDSRMIADYEVTWKDSLVSFTQEERVDERPCYDSGASSSKLGGFVPVNEDISKGDEMQALKLQMSMLEAQLNAVKSKLEVLDA